MIQRIIANLTKRRAVLDIGSGSIKLQVADVNIPSKKILQKLLSQNRQVLFIKQDFSNQIQQKGLQTLKEFKGLINSLNVEESLGIATEAFRKSSVGKQLIQRFINETGIPIKIIEASEQARLGFYNGSSLVNEDQRQLVVWDCGAGSFQMSSFSNHFHAGLGSGTVLKLCQKIKKTSSTPNPINQEQIKQLQNQLVQSLGEPPSWLSKDMIVIAVGTAQSIFNQQRLLFGKSHFLVSDVASSISQCTGLTDHQIHQLQINKAKQIVSYGPKQQNAPYVIPKLVLLKTVMERFAISSLRFFQTNGNCNALLTSQKLWNQLLKKPVLLTVNWHLQKQCNYKCTFCFAHFKDVKTNLNLEEGFKMLKQLKQVGGVYKVNFAGGQPFLNPNLGQFIKFSKQVGLRTSIITNASRLTKLWLQNYGPFLDQIGISCDSLNDQVLKELGRGFGQHLQIVQRAFNRINEYNDCNKKKISVKLNTVVMRPTVNQNWHQFILKHRIRRWKIFKILKIEGQNQHVYKDLQISQAQFQSFVERHRGLSQKGVDLASQDTQALTQSYLMITPDGRFYQNTKDSKYEYSKPVLEVGIKAGLSQVGFDISKFVQRGGSYALNTNEQA